METGTYLDTQLFTHALILDEKTISNLISGFVDPRPHPSQLLRPII